MGDWLRAGLPLADLRAGGLYAGAAGASNDHAEGFAACFVVTTPPRPAALSVDASQLGSAGVYVQWTQAPTPPV